MPERPSTSTFRKWAKLVVWGLVTKQASAMQAACWRAHEGLEPRTVQNGEEGGCIKVAESGALGRTQIAWMRAGHSWVSWADLCKEEAMACGAGLAAALAPACTARPVRLEAGLWSENITEHTQVLDLK